MSLQLAEFTEKLIPISDFSQGKAGKIFRDVAENDSEYVVLRNNQPTAVIMSVKEYKDAQIKLDMFEKILEKNEDIRALNIAKTREGDDSREFDDSVETTGPDSAELDDPLENVNIDWHIRHVRISKESE